MRFRLRVKLLMRLPGPFGTGQGPHPPEHQQSGQEDVQRGCEGIKDIIYMRFRVRLLMWLLWLLRFYACQAEKNFKRRGAKVFFHFYSLKDWIGISVN
jgi:hypothetical protein